MRLLLLIDSNKLEASLALIVLAEESHTGSAKRVTGVLLSQETVPLQCHLKAAGGGGCCGSFLRNIWGVL